MTERWAGMTPAEFLAAVRAMPDEELMAEVRGHGTGTVLTLLFEGMAGRYDGEGAAAGDVLLFVCKDLGVDHPHALHLTPDGARHEAGVLQRARGTIRLDVLRLLRIVDGSADPKRLLLTRRMRVGGDLLWVATVMKHFPTP